MTTLTYTTVDDPGMVATVLNSINNFRPPDIGDFRR
jgi:hypothetical protein